MEHTVKDLGRQSGFDLVRIGPAYPLHRERVRYLQWIADGRQAEMRWMTEERAVRAAAPNEQLPGAEAVISVGLSYGSGRRPPASTGTGYVARYAWGEDYHRVLGDMLKDFSARLVDHFGGDHRWYVDTGPAMDKALAQRSGLGWYGKNTNILTEQFGSYVLLGEIITTLPLQPDPPLHSSCGSCSLCMVACPTGALGPEYSLDSRKCISYLTIEHRGPIPRDLRAPMGAWVFGCDICQDVCPPTAVPFLQNGEERKQWAAGVRAAVQVARGRREMGIDRDAATDASHAAGGVNVLYRDQVRAELDLVWLLGLRHAEYVEAFRGSSIRRAKVWMLRRNAAVALGNTGGAAAIPPLVRALGNDDEPVVRGHAAWAIGQIGRRMGIDVRGELCQALEGEPDGAVREEIEAAIAAPREAVPSTSP